MVWQRERERSNRKSKIFLLFASDLYRCFSIALVLLCIIVIIIFIIFIHLLCVFFVFFSFHIFFLFLLFPFPFVGRYFVYMFSFLQTFVCVHAFFEVPFFDHLSLVYDQFKTIDCFSSIHSTIHNLLLLLVCFVVAVRLYLQSSSSLFFFESLLLRFVLFIFYVQRYVNTFYVFYIHIYDGSIF